MREQHKTPLHRFINVIGMVIVMFNLLGLLVIVMGATDLSPNQTVAIFGRDIIIFVALTILGAGMANV